MTTDCKLLLQINNLYSACFTVYLPQCVATYMVKWLTPLYATVLGSVPGGAVHRETMYTFCSDRLFWALHWLYTGRCRYCFY